MNTQQLRDTFLVTELFTPGQLNGLFTDLDRLVAGGAMPLKPIELPNPKETGRAFSSNVANLARSTSAVRVKFTRMANHSRSTGSIAFICRWARSRLFLKVPMQPIQRNFIF